MSKTTRLVLFLLCAIGVIYWIALIGLTAGSSDRIDWASRYVLLAFEIVSMPVAIYVGLEFRRRFFVDAAALADKDELTGLPNRRHFMERLDAAMARATRSERLVAVLFLDLDRFKLVNDTLGHSAGDRLLIEAARRFRSQVRSGESIARFGGDEFMILLEGLSNIQGAQIAAQRMLDASKNTILVNGHELALACSIGIALSDGQYCPPDELIRRADVALYQAKADGRACWRVFNASTTAPSIERLDIDAGLRRAIERDELCLHYQPEINLVNGRVEGFEALVRWQHPTRGLLPPGAFIEAAEEHGLIHELGKWVLRKACLEAVEWTHYFPAQQPLTISVNLSPFQLREHDLIADVEDILRETGIDNGRVKLEIVESSLIQDAEAAVRILDGFHRLGVRLAIDDFGTGYSSLSYLRRFRVDTLKIDRSFLVEATADTRLRAIVRSIVTLAHDLDIDVTAEGVETREQLSFLVAAGCDRAQGFLFAKPLPKEALYRFLSSQRVEECEEEKVAA